jgi:hypothetical protein
VTSAHIVPWVACKRSMQRAMLSNTFTAYTGSSVTGGFVATLRSASVAAGSPRYFSLVNPSNAEDIMLLMRNGSTTVVQEWRGFRGGVTTLLATAVYNQLQQITHFVNPTTNSMTVDGGTEVTSALAVGAFNTNRISVGMAGTTTAISVADARISEALLWTSELSSAAQRCCGPHKRTTSVRPDATSAKERHGVLGYVT